MLQVKYLIHGKDNKFAVTKKKLEMFPHQNESQRKLLQKQPEVFFKKRRFPKFSKIHKKHLCWSHFLIKLQAFRPVNF